jgi:CubicO group peptidase (beta-lactamase class C family)
VDKQIAERVRKIVKQAIVSGFFPGCVVGIVTREGRKVILPFGNYTYSPDAPEVKEETVYDTASITKSIPTSCLALRFLEEGRLKLTDKLILYIPEYQGLYREQITLFHLLTQTLEFPFRLSSFANYSPGRILQEIFSANLLSKPGEKYIYCNSTSILLGILIERALQRKLDKLAEEYFFGPLAMKRTTFHPYRFSLAEIVPTEIENGKIVQGIVHDESARVLVSSSMTPGSAGLFSTVPDLLIFLQMLLTGGKLSGRNYFRHETIEAMYTNQLAKTHQRVGLGWEISAPWMGKTHSKKVFGKTGFTGCFVLVDMGYGIGIVVLSNHTFPMRVRDRIPLQNFRSLLIDTIINSFRG